MWKIGNVMVKYVFLVDTYMLCEELGIDRYYVESSDWGIDVYIPQDWLEEKANEAFVGLMMWKRN